MAIRNNKHSWKLNKEDIETIIDLYVIEELGSITIAKKLNISKATVLRVLKANNVSRRSISEAGKKLFERGYIHPLLGTAKPKPEPIYKKTPFLCNDGYMHIWRNGKNKKYHRWIWEQTFGEIPLNCVIHHKDGNKLNNDLSNLEMMDRGEHTKLHWKQGDIRE